jgi:hypothetical protein
MSKAIKIKTHKMMVKLVLVFGSETWALAEMGMKRLGYRGQENMKVTWASSRARNVEEKK